MRLSKLTKAGQFVVATAVTAAMVAAQTGSAFALGYMSSYNQPTSKATVDSSLVTLGSHNNGNYGEVLGISQVTGFGLPTRLADGIKPSSGYGVFGTDVNSNPNPYYTNLLYNLYASEVGKAQTDHYSTVSTSGMKKPDSADTGAVAEYGGLSTTISYRPDILLGCDPKSYSEGNAIKLKSTGEAVPMARSSEATSGYTNQVEAVHNLKTTNSDYYQEGDEDYDPYYVELTMFYGDSSYTNNPTCGEYSLYSSIPTMYNLAEAADSIVSESKGAKTLRYGNATEIAKKYETYTRGLQHYVLKAIKNKKVDKKTVALVEEGGIDTTAKTISCYKSSPKGTVKASQTEQANNASLSRQTEAVEAITNNIVGTWTSTTDASWTATANVSDLLKADAIILESSADEAALKQLFSDAGVPEKKQPAICVNYPSMPGGHGWGPDNVVYVGYLVGYLYPELVNPVHSLAYYFQTFYHLKSGTTTLANVLGMCANNISLPKGVSMSLKGYSASKIESIIDEGIAYYQANKSSIDKNWPKLSLTTYMTKSSQKVAISTSSLSIKAGKSASIKAKGAKTAVSYSALSIPASAKGYISVSSKGKVTVKSGLAKGSYKIKVKASAKASAVYKAASATKTVTVKVS